MTFRQDSRESNGLIIRPSAIFLVITFAISWGLPSLYAFIVPDIRNAHSDYGIVVLISHFGPAIGALVAATLCGRAVLRQYFSYLTRVRIGWRWYVGIIVVVVAGLVIVLSFSHFVDDPPVYRYWNFMTLLLLLPPPISDEGAFEELGFRGWFLPLLQSRYPPYTAAFVVSAAWFLYHWSVLLPGYPYSPRLLEWDVLAVFFARIVALSFVFTIMFNATKGSVPLVFLAHWLSNVASKLSLGIHFHLWSGVVILICVATIYFGRRYLLDGNKVSVLCNR